MAGKDNLKPFTKDDPRINRGGRPRKLPSIDKLLVDVLGSDEDQDSEAKAILEALLKKAKKGDTRAAEILLDRGYGKPKQQLEVEGIPVKSFVIRPASSRVGKGNPDK